MWSIENIAGLCLQATYMRVCTQVWVKSGVTFLHEQNSFMLTHPRVCWQLSTHRTREVKLICNIPSFKRNRHQVTRKCGNCERIATWGGLLDAAPVFVRFNYDAHTKVEVDQPIRPLLPYSVLTVMHYVIRCDLDLWSMTLNISSVAWWNSICT